ncbi:MAG: glutamate racemase [Chitinophagales bacterium]|nr:glutamate racemase [Sphingobacteriales bacterium]
MNSQSIGIFDSGIGGLTVANAISGLLPKEHLVYFGDSAHMPYGEKSPELIQEFSTKITKYLIEEKKCKAIVIACNTASAIAYSHLKKSYEGQVPIINVIDPMIELIVASHFKKVGIIATRGTIESNVYQDKLNRRVPNQEYAVLATPLLASMIEENFIHDDISSTVISKYLSEPILDDIDSLVLACTHYPLIADDISEYYQGEVKLLLSGPVVAEKLKMILQKENLLCNERLVENEFIVSDLAKNFEKSAHKFYGTKINLKEVKL